MVNPQARIFDFEPRENVDVRIVVLNYHLTHEHALQRGTDYRLDVLGAHIAQQHYREPGISRYDHRAAPAHAELPPKVIDHLAATCWTRSAAFDMPYERN
jgi:hypothetical protein